MFQEIFPYSSEQGVKVFDIMKRMASQPQSGEKEVCLTLGMVRQWRENATKGQFLCIDAEKETCAAAEKPTMCNGVLKLIFGLWAAQPVFQKVAFACNG